MSIVYSSFLSDVKANKACIIIAIIFTDIQFVLAGSISKGEFLAVGCDVLVPGEGVVDIFMQGTSGEFRGSSSRGNSVYRGVLVFLSLNESQSGAYTCSVMVDGITVKTATFSMDVSSKLLNLQGLVFSDRGTPNPHDNKGQ